MGIQTWPPLDHTKKCRLLNNRVNFTIMCNKPNRNLLRIKETLIIAQLKVNLKSMMESIFIQWINIFLIMFSTYYHATSCDGILIAMPAILYST